MAVRDTLHTSNPGNKKMTKDLQALIEAAKKVTPTPEHREAQRRSFAYGNTAFENARITRDMIDREAEKLEETADGKRQQRT
jgi:hypothetical protein